MSVGAKTSVTMQNLLVAHKVVEGKRLSAMPKRKKVAAAKVEAKPAAPAAQA
jgi:hypothetical protein